MILRIFFTISALILTTTTIGTTVEEVDLETIHPDKRPWRFGIILELPNDDLPADEEAAVGETFLKVIREKMDAGFTLISTSLMVTTSNDTNKFYRLESGMLHPMLQKFRDAKRQNLNDKELDARLPREQFQDAKLVPGTANIKVRIQLLRIVPDASSEVDVQWYDAARDELRELFRKKKIGIGNALDVIKQLLNRPSICILFNTITTDHNYELFIMASDKYQHQRSSADLRPIPISSSFSEDSWKLTTSLRKECACANWTALDECHYKFDGSKDQCVETAENLKNKSHLLCGHQIFCATRNMTVDNYCGTEKVTRAPCERDHDDHDPCLDKCNEVPNTTSTCSATCDAPDGVRTISKVFKGHLSCCSLLIEGYPISEPCKFDGICTTGATPDGSMASGDEGITGIEETTASGGVSVNISITTTQKAASKDDDALNTVALGLGCFGASVFAFILIGLAIHFLYVRPRRQRQLEKTVQRKKGTRTARVKAMATKSAVATPIAKK